jgi:hypothetical protein
LAIITPRRTPSNKRLRNNNMTRLINKAQPMRKLSSSMPHRLSSMHLRQRRLLDQI